MNPAVFLLIVLTAGLRCGMAAEVAGTWEGTFGKGADAFYAGFDLDVTGGRITGAAFVQGWGYSIVSDGLVQNDRFRFIVDRKYTGDGPVTKIEFSGAVTGKSMTLAMVDATRYEGTLSLVESQATGPVSVEAAPQELQGKWTAKFVGPIGKRPKVFGRIDFEFQIDGNTLTGVAHAGAWPGDCPISQGKIENGRFSFTATGLRPSSSGIPVMRFAGEIHGRLLKLTLLPQIFGADDDAGLPMDATRP